MQGDERAGKSFESGDGWGQQIGHFLLGPDAPRPPPVLLCSPKCSGTGITVPYLEFITVDSSAIVVAKFGLNFSLGFSAVHAMLASRVSTPPLVRMPGAGFRPSRCSSQRIRLMGVPERGATRPGSRSSSVARSSSVDLSPFLANRCCSTAEGCFC